jgi:hypothetical protein
VPLGNGRFANRDEPGTTFDFGADSGASVARGASSSKDRGTSDTAETHVDDTHDANDVNKEMGWLTVRMWNQPGFVLTGGRIAVP